MSGAGPAKEAEIINKEECKTGQGDGGHRPSPRRSGNPPSKQAPGDTQPVEVAGEEDQQNDSNHKDTNRHFNASFPGNDKHGRGSEASLKRNDVWALHQPRTE